jgi:hypothetical protein
MKLARAPAMPPFGTGGSDLGCGIGFRGEPSTRAASPCSPGRAQRGEPALPLAPGGLREVRGLAGLPLVQPGKGVPDSMAPGEPS